MKNENPPLLLAPKICIKNRKHGSSSFSHAFNCLFLNIFWPQKNTFWIQIFTFYHLYVINSLARMLLWLLLQCTETLVLYLFYRKTWKKYPKVRILLAKLQKSSVYNAKNSPVYSDNWKTLNWNLYSFSYTWYTSLPCKLYNVRLWAVRDWEKNRQKLYGSMLMPTIINISSEELWITTSWAQWAATL